MGNKQIGELKFPLKPDQKVDHLRLNGNIQRRDRLVTDNKLRVNRQRSRNPNPLSLSPGKFMGKS